MATPDRTLLTEANVNDLSSLGRKLNDTSARLNVVEVATGTQYGNVPTLTNVTEIPSDVSGRVDLVYTQPTTVHFENPGLTDIVLSIEGYQHITWEGVSVHGTPDSTGVVWASAMWRDRDSTWHLLCEQDYAGSDEGNSVTTEKVFFSGYRNSQPNAALTLLSGNSVTRSSSYDPVVGTTYLENYSSNASYSATYAPADHPGLTLKTTLIIRGNPKFVDVLIEATVVAADWPSSGPPAFSQTVVFPTGKMPDIMFGRNWTVLNEVVAGASPVEARRLLGGTFISVNITNDASTGPGLNLVRLKQVGSAPTEDRTVYISLRLVGTLV